MKRNFACGQFVLALCLGACSDGLAVTNTVESSQPAWGKVSYSNTVTAYASNDVAAVTDTNATLIVDFVQIEATVTVPPASGVIFGGWEGDLSGGQDPTNNPMVFLVDSPNGHVLLARFGVGGAISATSSVPAQGLVSLSNNRSGHNTGTGGNVSDTHAIGGDAVVVSAHPASGYAFDKWWDEVTAAEVTGAGSSFVVTNTTTPQGLRYRAEFASVGMYDLTLSLSPSDGSMGTITNPVNVTSGTVLYPTNTQQITGLGAVAKPGFLFVRWDVASADPTVQVLDTTSAKSDLRYPGPGTASVLVTAVFEERGPYVQVTSTNRNGGPVGDPVPKSGTFTKGEGVEFSVTSPYEYGWSDGMARGICEGWVGTGEIPSNGIGHVTDNIRISNDSSIVWQWVDQYKLNIVSEGGGIVTREPDREWYDYGQIVQLVAHPLTEPFDSWSHVDSTVPTNAVVMTNWYNITAVFSLIKPDSDGDGMPDEWEIYHGLDPYDDGLVDPDHTCGKGGDPDGDGIMNWDEYLMHLFLTSNGLPNAWTISPTSADSDGDEMDDYYEFNYIGIDVGMTGDFAIAWNFVAPADSLGEMGPGGNLDGDYWWDTQLGYETEEDLRNFEEYTGPDGRLPMVFETGTVYSAAGFAVQVLTMSSNDVTANPQFPDTGDTCFSNNKDSDGDGFGDGFEFSWDRWQGVFKGTPVGDPLGHSVPYRFRDPALPASAAFGFFDEAVGEEGELDLLVANSGQDNVAIIRGLGDGQFAGVRNQDEYDVGELPLIVRSATFDLEYTPGQPDFEDINDAVVANGGTNAICVLLQDTDLIPRVFQNPVFYGTTGGPLCVAVGDLNTNNFTDIAVISTNAGGGWLEVFLNDGFGGFTPLAPVATGPDPVYVEIGNLRGNHADFTPLPVLDIAVVCDGDDMLYFYQNAGDGTVVFANSIPTGEEPSAIVIAEFDSDEYNDVAASCAGGYSVWSWHGNGDLTFTPPSELFLDDGWRSKHLASGQFNPFMPGFENTNIDVVVANDVDESVAFGDEMDNAAVLFGVADEVQFDLGDVVGVGFGPVWVIVAELGGTEADDFVVVCRESARVYVFTSAGGGRYVATGNFDTSAHVTDRRFDPRTPHIRGDDIGRADYDLLYDPGTGRVGGQWLSDLMEYHAWALDYRTPLAITAELIENMATNAPDPGDASAGGILRREFPTRRRCSHPFRWDTDYDRMPDGWEMALGLDPWDADTDHDGIPDDFENPDGDWMAWDEITSGTPDAPLKHNEVYVANGFHPRVGYGYIDGNALLDIDPEWVAEFVNWEEMVGPDQLPALLPLDPDEDATHPEGIDNDDGGGDTVWDSWEWYVGMDPRTNAYGDGTDWDGDGLGNGDEFRSYNTSTNVSAGRFHYADWWNKYEPTDVWNADTDHDQMADGAEQGQFNAGMATITVMTVYDLFTGDVVYEFGHMGGLSPTTADTDMDWMPDLWETSHAGAEDLDAPSGWSLGMNGTLFDPFNDWDGDGLENYQEYMMGSVHHWQYLHNEWVWYWGLYPTFSNWLIEWTPGRGMFGYDSYDFFNSALSQNTWYFGPGAHSPKYWDPQAMVNLFVPWDFMTACLHITGPWWSTGDPGDWDTDWDGMDDYWETYHSLNPLYGVLDKVVSKIVGGNVGVSPGADPWLEWHTSMQGRDWPWIIGFPDMDPDQDELHNIYESIQPVPYLPDYWNRPPYYHTDPSPLWMTDNSGPESFVNLYYWLGNVFWGSGWFYWSAMSLLPPPSYLYSFACEEGFDTDNDFESDRAELVDHDHSPGATDTINSLSPIKRRALRLNGEAAARTRIPYIVWPWELRNWTVQMWARPEDPARGEEQIFVERGGMVPQGNAMGMTAGFRVNFTLGIDGDGRAFARYHGAGDNIIFEEAKAAPDAAFTPNEWYHLATTYDGNFETDGHYVGLLKLFVDGQLVAAKATSEIPFNGFHGYIRYDTDLGLYVASGLATPLAVTVGARDWNGSIGMVYGSPIYGPSIPGVPPQPDLESFFHGWVDAVEIWDQARDITEIRSTMRKRYNRLELVPISTRRWDGIPWCMFKYDFDTTSDPDHDLKVPYGFDMLNGRPVEYAGVYWWSMAEHRSRVYDDYRYVPWIENLVEHSPMNPARDTTIPWDLDVSFYPNTANPYGLAYEHAYTALLEQHPGWGFGEIREQRDPHYSDMLPLLWAVADEDVEMWDLGGKGTDPYDSDGDLLPDGWEEKYGFDPWDPAGPHGGDADGDEDGLSNFYEYLTENDPHSADTDGDGLPDRDEDFDGDGLANSSEMLLTTLANRIDTDDDGRTDWEEVTGATDDSYNPGRPETSTAPTGYMTDPLDSLQPSIPRSMYFGTNRSSRLIVPPSNKLMTEDFTIEMWANPASNNLGGVLLSRYIQGTLDNITGINYEMGLEPETPGMLRPYVRYETKDGDEVRLNGLGTNDVTAGLAPILVSETNWTHLAATYNRTNHTLSLYVNALLAAFRTDATFIPPTSFGYKRDHSGDEVTIGASRSLGPVEKGFVGYIDEVRVWRRTRTAEEIRNLYNGVSVEVVSGGNPIRLRNRAWTPPAGIDNAVMSLPSGQQAHVMVRVDSHDADAVFNTLAAAGIASVSRIDGRTRVVKATPSQLAGVSRTIYWAGILEPADKIAATVGMGQGRGNRQLLVQFHHDVGEGDAVAVAQGLGLDVHGAGYLAGTYMAVTADDDGIVLLAGRDAVAWVIPCPAWLTSGAPIRVCAHCMGLGGQLVSAPFAVVGEGWDGPGRGRADLKFHFNNTTPDMPAAAVRTETAAQLSKWAAEAALTFTEAPLPAESFSLDITFGGADPGGAFDGPGGVLAYAYFPNDINPEPVAGDAHFDEGETWVAGAETGPNDINLRFVALHEFGHSLGLGHSADTTAVMFPFYQAGIADPQLEPDDIAGILTLYGDPIVGAGGMALELRFDDGGITAEDFTQQEDWMTDWASAAILDGSHFATNMTPPLDKDTDGDGMPDWWEMGNGLDPTVGTGNDGAYGDPDRDELNNIYEYLALVDYGVSLSPSDPDSDDDGFLDYDSLVNPETNARTFGEIYDDGDRIPDAWEVGYMDPAPNTGNPGLDPAYYDADRDPDEDGWSCYGEYMGSFLDAGGTVLVRSSDPLSHTNYPQPAVDIHVRYHGGLGPNIDDVLADGNGTLRVMFYKDARMDGFPAATLDMTAGTIVEREMTTGHLVEGTNCAFAYLDVNGNGTWEPGAEPAGVADPHPVIGWGDVNEIEIGLADQLYGYPRVSWPAEDSSVVNGYFLDVTKDGFPMFSRFIANLDRNYVHEGDFLYEGYEGVDDGSYVFSVSVISNLLGEIAFTNPIASVIYVVSDAAPVSAPTFRTASDFTFQYSRSEISWEMSDRSTAYRMAISTSQGGPAISGTDVVRRAPYRAVDGTYTAPLPFYAGDASGDGAAVFTNGEYWARLDYKVAGGWSPTTDLRFHVDLRLPSDGGKSAIIGDVYYFGKVARGYGAGLTNDLRIIIEAFESSGFSGLPDGQVQVSYVCSSNPPAADPKGEYALLGLHNGEHYVRAYLDLSGNRRLDPFEPYGFARENVADWDYEPRLIDLGDSGNVQIDNVAIVIRDRDTDDDQLPDGWEYMFYGHLDKGAGDLGTNGISLLVNYQTDPRDLDPTRTDYDYDGLEDLYEMSYSDLKSGQSLGYHHFDPYHPILNPDGTDLSPTRWDTDGDGLSDGYEVNNGLNPLDPYGDADGDSCTDAAEVLIAGTSPVNAADVLRVVKISVNGTPSANFSLEWEGRAGVTYRVQYSTDLETWLNAQSGEIIGVGLLRYTEQGGGEKIRFYRVVAR